jgi:transcription elongation GreA/GreB family factor
MEKLAHKKKVMVEAIKHQESIVSDFRQRILEIRDGEQQPQDEPQEYDQQGQENESALVINRLARELNFVIEELDFLKQMKTADNHFSEVSLGAIVKTDKMTFFPSVSLEEFEVDGDKLFGISREAPIYKEMLGKKKGDSFSMNGQNYKILDVY